MSEARPQADLPEHQVFGEGSSVGQFTALTALGLLMALAATWLTQDLLAPPLPAPAAPMATSTTVAAAAPAAPASAAASAGELQAQASAAAASAEPAASSAKPSCPEALSIYFPVGKAVPDEPGSATAGLARLALWARLHPNARIAVEGHADRVGVDESNLMLSYKRAKAVAAMLVGSGLPPLQVQIAAAGSNAPVEGTPDDARVNRRVTVHINDPDGCESPNQARP